MKVRLTRTIMHKWLNEVVEVVRIVQASEYFDDYYYLVEKPTLDGDRSDGSHNGFTPNLYKNVVWTSENYDNYAHYHGKYWWIPSSSVDKAIETNREAVTLLDNKQKGAPYD